jgi:hypothetical protein
MMLSVTKLLCAETIPKKIKAAEALARMTLKKQEQAQLSQHHKPQVSKAPA